MTGKAEKRSGGDLFIVDNSLSRWTGLEYLREWTDLARSFDVATGFFEIGSLLALDGKWQQLEKIRILMGDQVSLKTKKAFADALHTRIGRLEANLEDEKRTNPFLRGVESVVQAIRSGKIECRVYRKKKFHAKAYITYAKFDVIGAQALVGCSNFTRPASLRTSNSTSRSRALGRWRSSKNGSTPTGRRRSRSTSKY